MKYWALAYRLQLLQKGDKGSRQTFVMKIYYIGLVVNIVCGLVYGIPIFKGWIYILISLLQLCILVSCAVLLDAFKRLKQVKSSDQVVSTKPVVLLILSFGAYGLA